MEHGGEEVTTVHRVEYVVIEQAPLDSPIADAAVDAYIHEYDNLPEIFDAALGDIVTHQDSRQCGNCKDGVGYVLFDDDDYPERSGLKWKSVWLIRELGGLVGLLCEECSPIVPTDQTGR